MGIVDTNILLETGTNELEILEFIISGNSYGINVAKITELMQAQEVQEMPLAHPCVEGIFQPRNEVYTIVDLARYLGLGESDDPAKEHASRAVRHPRPRYFRGASGLRPPLGRSHK